MISLRALFVFLASSSDSGGDLGGVYAAGKCGNAEEERIDDNDAEFEEEEEEEELLFLDVRFPPLELL